MVDEDGGEEEKGGKREVRFLVQVYRADIKGFEHMIDVQLVEGHPLSHMALANRFYSTL